MNKTVTIILISLLSILISGLVILMVFLFKTDFNFSNITFTEFSSNKLLLEKEYESIKDLKVKSNVSDVKIIKSNDEKIKVEIYSDDAKEFDSYETNNEIHVSLNANKTTGFFKKGSVIKVYLPSSYDKLIDVRNNVGDVHVDSFENADFYTKMKVGDIRVKDIKNGEIISNIGDVKVLSSKELNVKNSTGDVKISNVDIVNVSCTTGDIKIENVNEKFSITSKTGDVKILKANLKENSYIKNKIGDVKVTLLNKVYVDASTNIGDKKVNNQDRKSNVTLKITSKVGDISVY